MNNTLSKKYGYLWVTLVLFVFSVIGHWLFALFAYEEEQRAHNQPIEFNSYLIETARDTLENWQSEFLQLIWQVAGLSILWYVGSPQSKEGDDRKEAKLDEIIKLLDKKKGEKFITDLDKQLPRQ